MLKRIQSLLFENGIALSAPIPTASCRITRPYLLERAGIDTNGTVLIFAIPYHSAPCEDPLRNCSRYAVSRDYHLFTKQLWERMEPVLRAEFPSAQFAMFADHAPIDERDAAARAGLGVLGENGLLVTKPYSSYVFIGEIVTNAPPPDGLEIPAEPPRCRSCGACRAACPYLAGQAPECLSALTQKKGELSAEETDAIVSGGSVWGCDLCQEVCPHTKEAIKNGTVASPIPFFNTAQLPHLTYQSVASMTDADFSERAYAWRGRAVILRNLAITEQSHAQQTEKRSTKDKST